VTPCRLVNNYRRLERSSCLRLERKTVNSKLRHCAAILPPANLCVDYTLYNAVGEVAVSPRRPVGWTFRIGLAWNLTENDPVDNWATWQLSHYYDSQDWNLQINMIYKKIGSAEKKENYTIIIIIIIIIVSMSLVSINVWRLAGDTEHFL
jgi:hypothetical protein